MRAEGKIQRLNTYLTIPGAKSVLCAMVSPPVSGVPSNVQIRGEDVSWIGDSLEALPFGMNRVKEKSGGSKYLATLRDGLSVRWGA